MVNAALQQYAVAAQAKAAVSAERELILRRIAGDLAIQLKASCDSIRVSVRGTIHRILSLSMLTCALYGGDVTHTHTGATARQHQDS